MGKRFNWIWLKATWERKQLADWARRNSDKPRQALLGVEVSRNREACWVSAVR